MSKFEICTHVETLGKLKELNLETIDAVYLGDPTCTDYPNLSNNMEQLKEAVFTLKELGKRAYLCTLAVPRNRHLDRIKEFLVKARELPLDGVEVHNLGVLRFVHKEKLFQEVHMGYFSNIYTHETVRVLCGFGVKRVFLNPELSLEEIQYIKEHAPADVVFFAHGKLPLGISENCFIKEYSPRECDKPCDGMWLSSGKWKLKNIGYATLSGKDWATLEYLGTLYYRGFGIFYIQGLRETPEYINRIAGIYKEALLRIEEGRDNFIDDRWIEEILQLCPNGLCNGYLFRRSGHRYIGKLFYGESIHELERRERHESR